MKQLITCICLCFYFSTTGLMAQIPGVKLKGTLTAQGENIAFGKLYLKEIERGTLTEEDGSFVLNNLQPGEYTLKIVAAGYFGKEERITITNTPEQYLELSLDSLSTHMDEVVITGTMKASFIRESPIKVEVLTQRFFQLNPTNSVIEAMETVNGVQEQINCGVCGTNDIHINGMEGPYTLVMIDGMPIVSALASVYGFNGLPVSLIDQVEVVKGPASSLYGSEAVGGVINIITKRPENAPRLAFNSFMSTQREFSLDMAGSFKVGKNWSSMLSGDYFQNNYRFDANQDGFTDIPLTQRISLFNRWSMKRPQGRMFDIAARVYRENRFGGEMDFDPNIHRGSNEVYGESIYTNRLELIGRYQLPIQGERIRLDFSYNYHDQDSYYGNTAYAAEQQTFFTNLVWDKKLGRHDLLGGLTARYQLYDDNTPATPIGNKDFIPGLFVQDEWTVNPKLKLLGGLRLDYHEDHKVVFTPRLALKYSPSEWTSFRLNAGKGFRLVNLFTEDHAALTGARTVVVEENLRPEQSYNINLNWNHIFLLGNKGSGTLDVDLFYTYFQNKIIPDYSTDPNLIIYRNLTEHAIVRGFSVAIDQRFTFPLQLKLGITYQDVYNVETNDQGIKEQNPQEFAPKFSGTWVISYEFKHLKLFLNYTGRVVGPMALPTYGVDYPRPEISPWYSTQNVQLTYQLGKNLDLYGGIKNIWNYTQPSPLVAPEDPFGPDFDTAYAYGPLQGRRAFLGIRWMLP